MNAEIPIDIDAVVGRPLRVVVAGAGAMGMSWLRAVERHPELELAGIVDLDVRRGRGAAIRLRRPDLPVGASLAELGPDGFEVCVNATPPAAHYEVTASALAAGLSVLTEKPFAADLAEAVALDRLARTHRRRLMVAQTRSYEPGLIQLRELTRELGGLNLVTTEFRWAYRPTGFRLSMHSPLLLDMAVHSFDAALFLTGQRPVAVYAIEFNPAHSWFEGNAAAVVTVELSGGVRYLYTGSWCAEGAVTSWNGRWRVDGEGGSVTWDGASAPSLSTADQVHQSASSGVDVPALAEGVDQVMGPLDDFVSSIHTGRPPWGDSRDNLHTFAIAQAAIKSARTGQRIVIADLVAEAEMAS